MPTPTNPLAMSAFHSSPVLPMGAFPHVGHEDVLPMAMDSGLPSTERVVPHPTMGERAAASKAAVFRLRRIELLCPWLTRASTTDFNGVRVKRTAASAPIPSRP